MGRAVEPPKVLLAVDDEPDILTALATYLRALRPEVQVVTAASGPEALEVLRRQEVGMILSDFRMPQMTGLQLLREALAMRPQVAGVLMTAFPDAQLAVRAVNEARIKAFLTKPVDPEKVLALVEEFLHLGKRSRP